MPTADHLLKHRRLGCRVIPVTALRQNCSLIWCRETLEGALVDPGGDPDRLLAGIEEEGVSVQYLLITHGHPDHAGRAADLAQHLEVPILGPHGGDRPLLAHLGERAADYGFPDCRSFTPDRWLADGEAIPLGRHRLIALHCPGHSDGHLAYYEPESRVAFVGDILFHGAIGATPDKAHLLQLLYAIRRILFPLGDDVVFVPGHERLSTFGEERFLNPFVSDLAAEDYDHLLDDLDTHLKALS